MQQLYRILILSLLCLGMNACAEKHRKSSVPTPTTELTPKRERITVTTAPSWMVLCQRRAELPLAPRLTIEAMLAASKTCEDLDVFSHPLDDTSRASEILEIQSQTSADLSPLAFLPYVGKLYIRHARVVDLTPLAQLKELTELFVQGEKIKDLRPLANLTRLQYLEVKNAVIDEPYCPKNSASLALNKLCSNLPLPCDPDHFTPFFLASKEERSRMPPDKVLREEFWISMSSANNQPYLSFLIMHPQTVCHEGFHAGQGRWLLPVPEVVFKYTQELSDRVYKLNDRIIGTGEVCIVDGKKICQIFFEDSGPASTFTFTIKGLDGTEWLRKTETLEDQPAYQSFQQITQGQRHFQD